MKRLRISIVLAATIALCVGSSTSIAQRSEENTRLSRHASGTFDVKLTPQDDKTAEGLGRMTVAKQIHGDLEATTVGQMLTAIPKVEGSAVYVAIERVEGTLHGRHGSFMLHHLGIMNQGTQQLLINVVPDSGTDQLSGIAGTMDIRIENGKHFYEFDYSLPGK